MKSYNVLVTAGGSVTALNVLRALSNDERFNLYSTDITNDSGSLVYVKKQFKVPFAFDKDYLDELLKICKRNKIDFLFPCNDRELKPISINKDKFKKIGCEALISDPETIDICLDKLATDKSFIEAKVNTPKLVKSNCVEKFPLMLRKRFSGLKKKAVFKVEDYKDLEFYTHKIKDEIILNEFVDGTEWTVDVICSPNGKVLEIVPRQRISVIDGNSQIGQINIDNKTVEEVKRIVEYFNIKDICCVQFKRFNNKNYYFEVNARVGSGLDLTVNAGVNMPLMAIENRIGNPHKPFSKKIKNKLKMVRYLNCHIIN